MNKLLVGGAALGCVTVLGLSAWGMSRAAANDSLHRDLQAAAAESPELALASGVRTEVVSAVESTPTGVARTRSVGRRGKGAVKLVVTHDGVPEVEDPSSKQIAEVLVPTPVGTPVAEPQSSPTTEDAVPQTVPSTEPDRAGDGPVEYPEGRGGVRGSGRGRGVGGIIGAIGGVVIRGGVVGDVDKCDPRGRHGHTTVGEQIGAIGGVVINNRMPGRSPGSMSGPTFPRSR